MIILGVLIHSVVKNLRNYFMTDDYNLLEHLQHHKWFCFCFSV